MPGTNVPGTNVPGTNVPGTTEPGIPCSTCYTTLSLKTLNVDTTKTFETSVTTSNPDTECNGEHCLGSPKPTESASKYESGTNSAVISTYEGVANSNKRSYGTILMAVVALVLV